MSVHRATASKLLASGVVRYSSQTGILILTGFAFGPTALGTYTLALAILNPFFILAGLGLRQAVLTLKTRIDFGEYEKMRIGTTVFILLGVWSIAAVSETEIALMLSAVATFKGLESIFEVYQAIMQRCGRESVLLKSALVLSSIQLISFGAFILVDSGLTISLFGSYSCYAAVLVGVVRRWTPFDCGGRQELMTGLSAGAAFSLVMRAGVPVAVSLFLLSLIVAFPQWILGYSGNVVDAGRFAVLSYIIVAIEIVLNAFAQAWISTARELESRGGLGIVHTARAALSWWLVVTPVLLIGSVGFVWLGPAVLGPAYKISGLELFPLIIGGSVTPFVFAAATAMAVKNRYVASLWVSIAAIGASAIVGYCLYVDGHAYDLADALATYSTALVVRGLGAFVVLGTGSRLPFIRF